MKTIIILIFVVSVKIIFTDFSFSQTFQWVEHEGVINSRDIARKTIFDQSGNMYVIGTFGSSSGGTTIIGNTSLTSHGQGDIFIAKYDNNRNPIWAKHGGSIYHDYIYGLETDQSGNIYLSGIFSKSINNANDPMFFGSATLQQYGRADLFVIKLNVNGEVVWTKSFGSTEDDQLNSMTKDAAGNLYITGGFRNSITFGNIILTTSNGAYQNFVAKINSDGNILWAKNSTGSTTCIGVDIISDQNGNTVSTGFFSGSINFGSTIITSHGEYDIMIVKYSPEGNLLWAKSFGGHEFDYGLKIDLDNDRNIYLTGSFELVVEFGNNVSVMSRGSVDVFACKFSPDGEIQWAREAGGPTINGFVSDETPSDFITDSQGNSYLTGYFGFKIIFENDTLNCESGGADVYVVKYDREGNINLKKKINGLEGGRVFSSTLSRNVSDEIFVSGSFVGIAEFDNINLQSKGTMDDLFIAKLSSITSIGNNTQSVPEEFLLLQNYPNPFNPKTVISYSITGNSYVSLKVFDALGKEVYTLVNEKQNEGSYKVEWNASEFPSGIYFYRLESENLNETKNMILLK